MTQEANAAEICRGQMGPASVDLLAQRRRAGDQTAGTCASKLPAHAHAQSALCLVGFRVEGLGFGVSGLGFGNLGV